MLNVPGICNYDPETTVSAHSNLQAHGKGKAIKAHDCFVCWACRDCHEWLDHGQATRQEKEGAFERAKDRTLLKMWELGLIQVSGASQPKPEPPYSIPKILPRR